MFPWLAHQKDWPKYYNWNNIVTFSFYARNQAETLDLFNGNTLTPIEINDPTNPAALGLFYTGSGDYNQFLQDQFTKPKEVRRIQVTGNDPSYLSQVFNLKYRDANGLICDFSKVTNVFFSKGQFQNLLNIDFKPGELILDNNAIISNYQLPTDTFVTFMIYYNEISRSNLLSSQGVTLCEDICSNVCTQQFSEEYMELNNKPLLYEGNAQMTDEDIKIMHQKCQ